MTVSDLAIGIDLGTTFSAIAYLDEHGKPTIIPNSDSERITPSVILFDDEEVIVGKIAKMSALTDPDRIVEYIKREMGNQDWEQDFLEKTYTPESISALILKRLIKDASQNLNCEIKEAVITVPAYFTDVERRATQNAGEIAGIKVLGIINEPTAAALAYGLDKLDTNQKILVYDLGGGTFDISILSIEDNKIEVLSTDGEIQLGGKDWDDEIINYVAGEFYEKYNVDPRDDLDAYQALRDSCEMAKIALSRKPKARIICQCSGNSVKVELTREKFNEITQSLLIQTETYLPVVIEKAGIKAKDIDTILLVGGSTRMPQVKEMLTKFFNKTPDDSVNPDECVAIGAAIYAAVLKLQKGDDSINMNYISQEEKKVLTGLKIMNVTAHGLGVIAKDQGIEKNCIVIPAQSQLPCEKSEMFGTESDNQTNVLVQIVEGEAKNPDECIKIGNCRISDLPIRPAGAPVKVTFKYNENGRIEVEALDQQTGKKAHTEIDHAVGLSQQKIEEQKEELKKIDIG